MSSKRRNGTDTDLKRLQEEFEAEFSRPKDHTTASWIRGEVVQKGLNPGSTMHSATMGQAKGALYRPGMQQVLKLTVHYSKIRPH